VKPHAFCIEETQATVATPKRFGPYPKEAGILKLKERRRIAKLLSYLLFQGAFPAAAHSGKDESVRGSFFGPCSLLEPCDCALRNRGCDGGGEGDGDCIL
jgi:hypothetical protein